MYGLINSALQNMIRDKFGDEEWEKVLAASGVPEDSFLTMRSYDDALTYQLAGAASEVLGAPVETCLAVPDGLSMIEAAATPETFFTVWTNVFMRGGLKAGERFLVHGGSSGIGTTAIQLANVAAGLEIDRAGVASNRRNERRQLTVTFARRQRMNLTLLR